jgi:hypothetical protein
MILSNLANEVMFPQVMRAFAQLLAECGNHLYGSTLSIHSSFITIFLFL